MLLRSGIHTPGPVRTLTSTASVRGIRGEAGRVGYGLDTGHQRTAMVTTCHDRRRHPRRHQHHTLYNSVSTGETTTVAK